MSVAFGVQNQGSVGTTASDLRQIIRYKWENTGIVGGLEVSGNTGLTYTVKPGLAICSKGDSDGYVEAYFPGGQTPEVSANTSSSARYDTIWIASNDATQGDADNLVYIGVSQGTPGQGFPDIPTYATPLANMLLPAGATRTSSASSAGVSYQSVPFGSSLGLMYAGTDTTNSGAAVGSSWSTYLAATVNLPTDHWVDIKRIFTIGSLNTTDSSVYTRILVDGSVVLQNEVRAFGSPAVASSQYFEFTTLLDKGTHTIQAQMRSGIGSVRKYWQKGVWAGQTLQVVDAGIALGGE